MSKDKSATLFENSISGWTLFFHDPEYEVTYRKTLLRKRRLNTAFIFLTYTHIASAIIYRIVSVISACTSQFIKTGGVVVEAVLLGFIIAASVIELLIRCCERARMIQGFFIYASLGIFTITGAFYAQKGPVFGIMYFFFLYWSG